MLSEIGNMVTNMTGSSILKSTGHTGWVKPLNLLDLSLEIEIHTVMKFLTQSLKVL